MSSGGDLAHQGRVALRHPAKNEKCCADVVVLEQPQQPLGVGYDPALKLVPRRARHHAIESRGVEVILHIDRHRIDNAAHFAPRRSNTVLMVSSAISKSNISDMCFT